MYAKLGKWSEARSLSEAAGRDDPYGCAARVCGALAARALGHAPEDVTAQLAAAAHLDPADLIAIHNLALTLEGTGAREAAEARWQRVRAAAGAGSTMRALAAAGLARSSVAADHWYSMIGSWDAGVSCALARLHADTGDALAAKHHYQDVEAVWPCELSALQWLAGEAPPEEALQYYRRAARLQPTNPEWGLLMGGCLRASGRYQEALALYKKLNSRFPDNVQCLRLIVKLCGDQGLSETSAWSRELQRAQTRAKQQERATVASAGSISSGASQSPVDQIRGVSRGEAGSRRSSAQSHIPSTDISSYEVTQPMSRSLQRVDSKKKNIEEFDDDLPLPPE